MQKMEIARQNRMSFNAFGTTDALQIAQKIIIDGELHLTTEQKKKIQDEKKTRVINIIATNAINPRPRGRIPRTNRSCNE